MDGILDERLGKMTPANPSFFSRRAMSPYQSSLLRIAALGAWALALIALMNVANGFS